MLRRHFDEKAGRGCSEIKAFIAATNVQTGKVRIFTREELSIDAPLASACLPNVHEAVVIDGVPYWDDGFRGNPPIWPFIYDSESSDVVLVEVDPPFRAEVPRSNAEIADRLNEITFGGALMAEMRAIAFVQDLIERTAEAHPRPFDRRSGLAGALGRGQQVQHRAGIPKTPVRSRARGGKFVAGRRVRLGRQQEHARHPRAFSVN
jgi:predicted acylesterase/phospholipase RssA